MIEIEKKKWNCFHFVNEAFGAIFVVVAFSLLFTVCRSMKIWLYRVACDTTNQSNVLYFTCYSNTLGCIHISYFSHSIFPFFVVLFTHCARFSTHIPVLFSLLLFFFSFNLMPDKYIFYVLPFTLIDKLYTVRCRINCSTQWNAILLVSK